MRKVGEFSQITVEIIIVTAIVIILNIFGQYFYTRADLTSDKQYTLAQSSREIVANLPDLVRIKVYISPELPPDIQTEEQKLRDLLDEYRANASNKLIIQYIYPENLPPEELQALQAKGIQEVPYRISGSEEMSMGKLYMGMIVSYVNKDEVLPVVAGRANLEYDITSSILKLISPDMPAIGFLTGHGEPPSSNYKTLNDDLKELYTVQDVDLRNGQKVPDNVDTILIVQPTETFTQRHKYVLDQFLMRGGKLVVMMNNIKMDQVTGQAQLQVNPLESLLGSYGVKIKSDLVVDLDYNLAVQTGRTFMGMPLSQPYPLFPQVISTGFDPNAAATRGLTSLGFPYASSVELLYDKISDDAEIFELARTSDKSDSHIPPINIDPNREWMPPGGESEFKKQLVAVQITGVFNSAYADQPIPAFDPDPNVAEGTLPQVDTEGKLAASQPTSLVVIGNGNFIDDNAMGLPGNEVFFMNLMETLNIGEKLIDIRSRTITNRPLDPDLTDSVKNGLRFWGYGAVPVIVTLFGVTRFYLKGQRKRLLQAMKAAEKEAALKPKKGKG
jgi:gliding-associated putative ABC transporter substrate-binding component GldG